MESSPKVSIIILNLNNAELTLECVNSAIKCTQPASYEIIVVDNGSDPADCASLTRSDPCRFRTILLNRNMFFGEANNIGAECARGEYLVFLNNDVKVTAGWIEPLLRVINTQFSAGAVGPRMMHPDGTLLEAGSYIRPDGWTTQLGKAGSSLPSSYVDATQVVDYCSAACLLVQRERFLGLGGFDPIFDPAYFEDVDLALRLRSIGYFTYYCGEVSVVHDESTTSRRLWTNDERYSFIAKNHDRFLGRWGRYLSARLEGDCEPAALPPITWRPETAATGKSAVVLYSATPLSAAEPSRRLLHLASALERSHDIIIASTEIVSRCRVYSLCREFEIDLNSFAVRRIADIAPSGCISMVTFGVPTPLPSFQGKQIAFESDGHKLLDI